jgi:hypothetical protein
MGRAFHSWEAVISFRSEAMDVLAQALHVVRRAEAARGQITLTLDLDDPGQRAAYAAAVAVLQAHGIDPATLTGPAGEPASAAAGAGETGGRPGAGAAEEPEWAGGDLEELDERDAALRRAYAEALAELTPDERRRQAVLRDTFPRVREVLQNGANVFAVAQIQYQRWIEEHLSGARDN